MRLLFSSLLFLILLAGCTKQESAVDVAAYKKSIEEWQQKRDAGLRRDQGWLTLCGLFWLIEGENKMGTALSNLVVFPEGKAPQYAGSLWLKKDVVRLEAPKTSEIRWNDSVVTSMILTPDNDPVNPPTVLSLRKLTFQIIYRSGQYGVRIKDRENPTLVNFKGMKYFPIDPKWRFDAKFVPYTPPKMIPIATVIGTTEQDSCPGAVVFDVDGKEMRLETVIEVGSENQLFIMFSDETSGNATYGMGRQVYTDLPDTNNHVVLDFNKAYNWPCVFTEYATCPIPPRQNHLPLRVEAGEKMFDEH